MSIIKDIIIKAGFHDPDLSKIRVDEKKREILNILHSSDPEHYERLWMVGFLRYVEYSQDEILDIIHKGNAWSDYDPLKTQRHVLSVFRQQMKRDIQDRIIEGAGEEITVLTKRNIVSYEPEACQVGHTRVICYYKQCEKCPLRDDRHSPIKDEEFE